MFKSGPSGTNASFSPEYDASRRVSSKVVKRFFKAQFLDKVGTAKVYFVGKLITCDIVLIILIKI